MHPNEKNAFRALEVFSVMAFHVSVKQVHTFEYSFLGQKLVNYVAWVLLDWGSHVKLRMSFAWPREPKYTPSRAIPALAFSSRLSMSTRNKAGERTEPCLTPRSITKPTIDLHMTPRNFELFSSICHVFPLSRDASI